MNSKTILSPSAFFVNSFPGCFFVLSHEGLIISISNDCCKLLGIENNHAGQPVFDLLRLSDEDNHTLKLSLEKAKTNKETTTIHCSSFLPPAKQQFVTFECRPVLNQNEEAEWILLMIDFSKRKTSIIIF
ncbi:MAG: hypothetical protein QM725_06300 [Lacibacter sp.]